MMHDLVEHRFSCPYCWESITMLLEPSSADQAYVEDCEVCCQPISLRFRAEDGAIVDFHAEQLA